MLRSKKEEQEEAEEEITIPSVDNMELLRCKTHTHTHVSWNYMNSLLSWVFPSSLISYSLSSSLLVGQSEEGMSGVAIFFTVLFSMLGCIFLIVIGLVVYSHWNESRRKRFYWGRGRGGGKKGVIAIAAAVRGPNCTETKVRSRCRPVERSRLFYPDNKTLLTGNGYME